MRSKTGFSKARARRVRIRAFLLLLAAITFFLFLSPAYAEGTLGVWNGFLDQTNIVECHNGGEIELGVMVNVINSSGLKLGEPSLNLPPYATRHLILNELGIEDQYGTYELSAVMGDLEPLRCMTAFYKNSSPGSEKPLEYAFSIPAGKSLRGEASGVYNSMNPAGDGVPTYNWLSIYNEEDASFRAVIRRYDQQGALREEIPVVLSMKGERQDFSLGHEEGQVVGIYEIIPEDEEIPYGAYLARYQQTQAGEFVFAFVLFPEQGFTDSGYIPASTMDPATN